MRFGARIRGSCTTLLRVLFLLPSRISQDFNIFFFKENQLTGILQADPWETNNLARGEVGNEHKRLLTRLNAVLMVTKSCTSNPCRDPWSVLQPLNCASPISSLTSAMNPEYDSFFANIPNIRFGKYMQYQDEGNEVPFYPPGAEEGLGKAFREARRIIWSVRGQGIKM